MTRDGRSRKVGKGTVTEGECRLCADAVLSCCDGEGEMEFYEAMRTFDSARQRPAWLVRAKP
jgi:hypothetical protein